MPNFRNTKSIKHQKPKIQEIIKLSKNKPTEHWTQHIPDERKQQPSRCVVCNIQCVRGSNITIRQKNGLAMKLDPVGSNVRYEMMKLCTGSV